MSILLKWYSGKLKSHPTVTNLSSALVIMSLGDVMAQGLERNKLGDAYAGSNPELEGVPERRRLHFLQYGTHGHPHDEDEKDDYVPQTAIIQGPPNVLRYDGEKSTSNWSLAVDTAYEELRREFEVWDGFRTATMALWGVGIYAPAFMYLYRLYDRFLPKKSPAIVAFQVLFNVIYSIPVNALFFTHGSFVHHTAEWFAIQEERHEDLEEMSSDFGLSETYADDNDAYQAPFDWEMLWSKTRLKIHSELYTTVSNSVKVWVPINAVTFTVIPPHLRPLSFMVCSVFWNCYLSLVQHRDAALPEGV